MCCWRCNAATRDRRCDAVDTATLRCGTDAGPTLRHCSRCDAATLHATQERRCDAVTLLRRCEALRAATLQHCETGALLRRCDAVGAATLPSARVHTAWLRGWTRWMYIAHDAMPCWHQGTQGLNDVSFLSC